MLANMTYIANPQSSPVSSTHIPIMCSDAHNGWLVQTSDGTQIDSSGYGLSIDSNGGLFFTAPSSGTKYIMSGTFITSANGVSNARWVISSSTSSTVYISMFGTADSNYYLVDEGDMCQLIVSVIDWSSFGSGAPTVFNINIQRSQDSFVGYVQLTQPTNLFTALSVR